jgi:hypothetical protein
LGPAENEYDDQQLGQNNQLVAQGLRRQ